MLLREQGKASTAVCFVNTVVLMSLAVFTVCTKIEGLLVLTCVVVPVGWSISCISNT